MGKRHKRHRTSSTSSSSSSDSEPGPKRGPRASPERSRTPPQTDQQRIERLEKKLKQLSDQNKRHATVKSHVASQVVLKPDLLPEFTPGNPNLTCEKWVQKIDQLASIHKWSDSVTSYHMMSRLVGLAKNWYNNLDPSAYDMSWKQWKRLLLNTFPDHHDFATMLRKMISREKEDRESWSQYYFGKLSLLQACKVSGKDAVSCLIDGIKDSTLRNGAIAGRYTSPEQLYTEYLSTLKTDAPVQVKHRLTLEKRRFDGPSRKMMDRRRRPYVAKCYNCSQEGHMAAKCPKPRLECHRCRRLGHREQDCSRRDVASIKKGQVMQADCKESTGSSYMMDILLNGQIVKAFVDSGAGPVLITEETAKTLGLSWTSSNQVIHGYGGGVVGVLGEVQVEITADLSCANVKALIVSNDAQSVPVLLGRRYLSAPGITLIANKDEVRLLDECQTLTSLNELPPRKVLLRAEGTTTVPPHTIGFMPVISEDEGEVYVECRQRLVPGQEHVISRCVTQAAKGVVSILNASSTNVTYETGQIVARGERCQAADSSDEVSVLQIDTKCLKKFTRADLDPVVHKELPELAKEQLLALLNEFRDCFALGTHELGKTNITEMTITLNDASPVVYRPYRLSHHERGIVREIVDDLLENEIIRESQSQYASPILLVKKKEGQYRLCVDYRQLNAKTVKDRFPLPRVDDHLDQLKGANCFTTLDMASGYYQIPVSKEAIPKTAFITPDGHYEYLRMPFGLANAPAVFQRTVNQVLGKLRFSTAFVYMDDVLVPSKDFESGLTALKEVFTRLRDANLKLKLSKCSFFREAVEYLGHEISSSGVKPGKRKTEAIQNYPRPTDVHKVRQFLGLAGYFRKYVRGYANIASGLTSLLKKGATFVWGSEQEEAFTTLKEHLVQRPILAIYDPTAETELHTDASKVGIGGILLQRQTDGSLRPVLYYSRQTSKEERRYHSYELETLAVVDSMKHYRVYLLGIQFKVITDCNALRSTFTKRDMIPRIGRWWLLTSEFTFTVEYRPGSKMSHVDALSRNPIESDHVEQGVLLVNVNEEDWILTTQMRDERCRYLLEVLQKPPTDAEERAIHKDYRLNNNRLYKITETGNRWVVPKAVRRQILLSHHDGIGHLSEEKTLNSIAQQYWFPSMRRYVRKYISSCLECLYNKEAAGKPPGFLNPIPKKPEPFDTLHIDHLGPFVRSKLKNAYLIVVIDAFTKFVFLKAVPSTKVGPVIKFLDSIIETFGVPRRLISDRGACFTSKQFVQYCKDQNMKLVLNATATPRANGQVERFNRTILSQLSACVVEEDKWDTYVSRVRWGLNSTRNSTTGKTPYQLFFGYSPRSIADAILTNVVSEGGHDSNLTETREEVSQVIQEKQRIQKEKYDMKRCKPKKFQEGDLVLVRRAWSSNDGKSKKLLPKFSGPYVIKRVLDHDRYVVADLPGAKRSQKAYTGVHSVDKLKPYSVAETSGDESMEEERETSELKIQD